MLRTIENSHLRISVSDRGAELCSIYDRENEREILWQADTAFWGRHAPVLFPNVGRHSKDVYRVNGRTYSSHQHGFARDMDFVCVEEATESLTHRLESTEETLAAWPFPFRFSVTHSLSGRELTISWSVENPGSGPMYFTIGGHPAFSVPAPVNDPENNYRLKFEGKKSLHYLLLDPASGTAVPQEIHELPLAGGVAFVDAHTFGRDAMVFDGGQIEKAGILLPDGKPYLELVSPGFPCFGIWSRPGAPFVCLEPWMGRCDDEGFCGELSEKAFINMAKPGETFRKSYEIRVF
ncbi:MAG: aldose 1-epimerase family protein [Clostridiales bacterium]|nr:aldose 1-epimerase family protein [Clostridiales bacterium]